MPEIRPIITKPENIRNAIRSRVVEAISAKFPIETQNCTAVLKHIEVERVGASSDKQTEALMSRGNIHDGVYADIDVLDKNGHIIGQLKNHRLMNLPYYSNRYTMLLDGHEYSIVSQMRTKSGVYTRKRGNDELESAFNLARGANFKLVMEPDTGVFSIDLLNSTMPAFAVLRILGASPADIQETVGKELYEKNSAVSPARMERARNTLYDKLVAYRDQVGSDKLSAEEKDRAIRQYFTKTQIDPETTNLTLGTPFSSVSARTILQAMKKMLSVYKGDEDIDERDHLEFQKIYSIEDLLKEVIDKAPDTILKIRSKLNSFKPSGNKEEDAAALKSIFSPVYFTRPVQRFITGSSLSRMPSQINPVEFLDSASIITRLGEGGISSERAVPFETRGVNNSYIGVIDPIAAPESSKVGIDVHCTMGAYKGDDNEFYKHVIDCKTGKPVFKRVIELHNKYLGFPDPLYNEGSRKPTDMIPAIYKGKITRVPRSQLDYQIMSPHDMTTYTTNTVPFANANQGNRLLMGDKHIQQSLPLENPEKRLVSSSIGPTSVEKAIGNWTLPKSPVDGTVSAIKEDTIVIKGNDGKKYTVDYDHNLPLATKTFLDNRVIVKVGDKVKANQPLAESNFTRDGELTMGRNLTVAYMPYFGLNHEDGIVLSESASKKMTSVHADKVTMNITKDMTFGKKKYVAVYPTTFTQEQLEKLDENGVAKKGAILEEGDPVILALTNAGESRQNQVLGLIHKSLIHPYKDSSEVYEEHFPGEVTNVHVSPSLITVVIKVKKQLQVGDKLAGSYGNKGVCSKILPDDQMPRDADGNPLDAVLTSTSVISRINPAQILETTLGKIAKKKGVTYNIENYSKADYTKFVLDELKKHHMSDTETVTDPVTGKKIPGVFVGVQHMHKLFKTSDTNLSGRGIEGPHDMDDAPSGSGFNGPKAIGGMEVNALIAHNARSVLRESTVLRGAKNAEFWKAFQAGQAPNFPAEKKTFNRFVDILKQAGINVTRQGDDLIAAPLTDKDILAMSSGEISDGKMLFAKTLQPEPGGLFDPNITGGLKGTKWSHIKLVEPVVNPVFKDAAKSVLGMSTKEFDDASVNKGGKFIRDSLNAMNVQEELQKEKDALNSGNLTKGALDASLKRMKYLRALDELHMKAGDAYMLSVVPVTPPSVRPVVVGRTGDTMDNDANKLYQGLILQNNVFRKIKNSGMGEEDVRDNRRAINERMAELTGMIAPSSPQMRGRGVKGALDFISGDVPKEGYFQKKVIYGKMNLTGRSTITPDETVGLDEVGLPEKVAWEMYKPFLIRGLSQMGYTPLAAKEAVENRTDVARKVLQHELEKRPVIINRAPTLWRHGIMAAKPVLRADTNLHVNSLWESSLNADYDGDAMQIHLPITDEAIRDAKKMFPSQQLFSDKKKNDLLEKPTREPVIGLYVVTANVGKPRGNAKVHKYRSVDEAWKDYYAGKLKMTDYVDIS